MISRFIPGDPVLAFLPDHWNQSQYDQIYHQLGLDQPITVQFFMYVLKMLSGDWGYSNSIARGIPVVNLFVLGLPRTMDVISIPLIVSLVLGVFIGMRSMKTRFRVGNRLSQVISLIILAIPIILIAMLFQYFLGYLVPIFPTTGYKTYIYPDPPLITGSRIFDSMLSGQWYLIPDYLYHLALPWITLTIFLIPFMIVLVRSYLLTKLERPSSMNFESITLGLTGVGVGFGMVVTFAILLETTFGLSGLGQILIQSISNADFWVLNAFLFLIPWIFIWLVAIGCLLFIIYRAIASRRYARKGNVPQIPVEVPHDAQPSNPGAYNSEKPTILQKLKKELKELGDYLFRKLKSPFTFIGLCIIIFVIVISIFPQILTPYTLDQANGIYSPWYGAPSLDHPLGTTRFGRDVLARIVYGTQHSLLFGLGTVGIGLLGGIILGIPINLFKRRLKMSPEILLTPVYMYPLMIAVLLGSIVMGSIFLMGIQIWWIFLLFGILMIPIFTQLIANTKLSVLNLSKKIIPYIPLLMGFVLMVDFFLGFLGFSDPRLIQLGNEVSQARGFLYSAPWASFYPMLTVSFLLIGLFLLYAGLQKSPREIQELQGTIRL
jgi:peptide/nickel transport system permease protein